MGIDKVGIDKVGIDEVGRSLPHAPPTVACKTTGEEHLGKGLIDIKCRSL